MIPTIPKEPSKPPVLLIAAVVLGVAIGGAAMIWMRRQAPDEAAVASTGASRLAMGTRSEAADSDEEAPAPEDHMLVGKGELEAPPSAPKPAVDPDTDYLGEVRELKDLLQNIPDAPPAEAPVVRSTKEAKAPTKTPDVNPRRNEDAAFHAPGKLGSMGRAGGSGSTSAAYNPGSSGPAKAARHVSHPYYAALPKDDLARVAKKRIAGAAISAACNSGARPKSCTDATNSCIKEASCMSWLTHDLRAGANGTIAALATGHLTEGGPSLGSSSVSAGAPGKSGSGGAHGVGALAAISAADSESMEKFCEKFSQFCTDGKVRPEFRPLFDNLGLIGQDGLWGACFKLKIYAQCAGACTGGCRAMKGWDSCLDAYSNTGTCISECQRQPRCTVPPDILATYCTVTSPATPPTYCGALGRVNPPITTAASGTGDGTTTPQTPQTPAKVNGGWTDWGPSTCLCGSDQRRTCTNPAPSGGGNECEGDNHRQCPTDTCRSDPAMEARRTSNSNMWCGIGLCAFCGSCRTRSEFIRTGDTVACVEGPGCACTSGTPCPNR